jgi:Tfp pilus assembly protein PilF
MKRISLTASAAVLGLISACSLHHPKPNFPTQEAVGAPGAPGAQTNGAPSEDATALPSTPGPGEQHTPPRHWHMNPATTALVEKARGEASGGNFVAAYATLERAQHIDPQNPLVWVQMGQVKLQEGNAVQAFSLGKKALNLASGDPTSQGMAWRLIADSYRAQGKDPDAADAQRQADMLSPR